MKKVLLILPFLSFPFFLNAAEYCSSDTSDIAAGGKLSFEKTDETTNALLSKERPHESKSIPTPKFVMKSGNNNFLMTIGGEFDFIMGGDMGNDLYKQDGAGVSFVTNAIPVPAVKGHKGDFYINPINGSVDLQVVAFANTKDALTGYFKVGTNGISTSLALQRAYINYRGFTGGLKLTLFQDDYACQPPTIDPQGPSGCVSAASYEFSYKSKSYNGFRFALGLDIPTFYSAQGYYRGHDFPALNGDIVTGNVDNIIPDIPAWVEYSFSQWNRIRLSGILRNFTYEDMLKDKIRHTCGWGAMLSGNIQPADKWILYYQLAYGKGIGAYLQDIAGHPYSFIPCDDKPGYMKPSPMMGVNLGVTFNPTSKLQFNAVVSESRIWDVSDYANAQDEALNYKYAHYGAVNCFYNINSFLQVGIEYLYGHRQTWNIGGASDNRLQAQFSFTF